jgi:hypothetical protein
LIEFAPAILALQNPISDQVFDQFFGSFHISEVGQTGKFGKINAQIARRQFDLWNTALQMKKSEPNH